jgi:hypothetical protein
MNKIKKYNYEDIRNELPRYVVYIVDKNNKFHSIFRTGLIKKKLISFLETNYRFRPYEFFIVYKFGFHTGTKPLQGGPLSITISSLVFDDHNHYKLVSGYTKDKKYKNFHGKVWFQRKYLETFGWHNDYLDCITKDLLDGKVHLLPLIVNMFNVYFPNCHIKEKPKTYTLKHKDMEIVNLINRIKETEIKDKINTKELKDKLKEIESISKTNNKKKTNDLLKIIKDIKKTKIKDKSDINNLLNHTSISYDDDELNFLKEYDDLFNELNNISNISNIKKQKIKPNLNKKYIEDLNNLDDFTLNHGLDYQEPKHRIKKIESTDENVKDWTDIFKGGKRKKKKSN